MEYDEYDEYLGTPPTPKKIYSTGKFSDAPREGGREGSLNQAGAGKSGEGQPQGAGA